MDKKTQIKIMELSFNIMEKILTEKKYTNKEEVMSVVKNAIIIAEKNDQLPTEIKMAYTEAYEKLNSLTWDEMEEIRKIIDED